MRGYEVNYLRIFWLGIYILAAIVAASLFAARGMLGGDSVGIPLPDIRTLIVATSSVVIFYLIWMGPVFNALEKLSISPLVERWKDSGLPEDDKLVSIFVLIVQGSFLIYCFVEGAGVAGSTKRVDLAIKYVWILLPADVIFFVYYAMYRQSRWFLPSLILYILSNMLRGWLGFWLIIAFLEGAFRIREKRFDWKKISLTMSLFVYAIPFLIEIKWAIRKFGNAYILNWQNLSSVVNNVNWWESIVRACESVLMRLQHLDIMINIIINSTALSEKLRGREFLYFFEEGLPQFTLERLLGWARVPDIHIRLIDYFAVYPAGSGVVSNTHTGLVGWLWIIPEWAPVYLIYVLMLTWAGIWLAKKLGANQGTVELVWFAVLVWVMNGWFGAYIEFLQALVVVLMLKLLAGKLNEKSRIH